MNQTPEQRTVLAHGSDLLVTGGPGSGKTTVGLLKARDRIERGLTPGQAALFISFSNSAIHQIMSAAQVTLTPAERQCLEVQTFHSFCWDVLRTFGHLLALPHAIRVLAPEQARAERAGLSASDWAARERDLAFRDGLVGFDLFAPLVRELLSRSSFLRCQLGDCYPLVIVDEFQDTDDDQWQVVHLMTGEAVVVALGDPHQRIHDFRPGVSPDRLDEFVATRRASRIDLSGNHRSPNAGHLRYATHVLHPGRGPYGCDSVRVERYRFSNQAGPLLKRLVLGVEQRVRKQRGEGPVSTLVLGPSHAAVRQMSEWLSKPTKTADYALDHEAFADSDLTISAWHVLLAALGTCGQTPERRLATILRRMADYQRCFGSVEGLETAARLSGWAATVEAGGRVPKGKLIDQLSAALVAVAGLRWTGDLSDDLRNLRGCFDGVEVAYARGMINATAMWSPFRPGSAPSAALETLFRRTAGYAGAGDIFRRSYVEERMADRYRPRQGRHVMTLHASKGKEYDAVVIYDGQHPGDQLLLRNDPPPYERSRRLLHVALTRARHSVAILTPDEYPSPLLPSPFARTRRVGAG